MNFSLKQSFEDHSKQYGDRVKDRKKYAHLSLVDQLISSFIKNEWPEDKRGVLLDAACGSGDRLRMLFEIAGLSRYYFKEIIGYDYTQGMLDMAATQTINGKPVYDELRRIDLLESLQPALRADLILCLWQVTNSVDKDTPRLITNLANALSSGGYLVYDVLTVKESAHLKQKEKQLLAACPDLKRSSDRQHVWHQRDDKSIGYVRMLTPAEINDLLVTSKLKTCAVWGYGHQGILSRELAITDNKVDELEVADYSDILVVQQRQALHEPKTTE